MTFIISCNTYAQDTTTNQTKIIIHEDAKNVPDYIIQQLLDENPEAKIIHIHECIKPSESTNIETSNIYPKNKINNNKNYVLPLQSDPGYISHTILRNMKTTTKTTNSQVVSKDDFVISVAKGQTIKMAYTYKGSLTGSITGNPWDTAPIGANITITAMYTSGTKYEGPEKNSPYNCREFRVKYYEEVGTYTQTVDVVTMIGPIEMSVETKTKTGIYRKPLYAMSYSIYHNI